MQVSIKLCIFAGKCNLKVNVALLESPHIDTTAQQAVKPSAVYNPMHHLSPRAKTNISHPIDLDANGVLTHGGK